MSRRDICPNKPLARRRQDVREVVTAPHNDHRGEIDKAGQQIGGGAVAVPAEEVVSLAPAVTASRALLAVLVDAIWRVGDDAIHRPQRREDVSAIAQDQAAVPDNFLAHFHSSQTLNIEGRLAGTGLVLTGSGSGVGRWSPR